MARRKKSLLEPAEAHNFAMTTIHDETAKLLRIVEAICQRYPPNDDLIFVRYLLRMVAVEAKASKRSRKS
ncbi:hypothetical protein [Rhizobium sp. BE258]|uniref:hypothetical protein n=1 Tax=Rhizobium sp. BE258 TaxID=2817722 RepID=UPI0028658423|nr:hypothetical protein [Rhizobium sp. BE258]MDR7145135.1 hypothetical protein [Rhizobium sp. BE258]